MNMFATTAATASQSSYAIYWDMERRAFLGDRYSVMWMEDSEKYFNSNTNAANPKETLENQFDIVYKLVNPQSQPQQFGKLILWKDWFKTIKYNPIFNHLLDMNIFTTFTNPQETFEEYLLYLMFFVILNI